MEYGLFLLAALALAFIAAAVLRMCNDIGYMRIGNIDEKHRVFLFKMNPKSQTVFECRERWYDHQKQAYVLVVNDGTFRHRFYVLPVDSIYIVAYAPL
ncbi:hypothetical protein [Parapedobacter sp. 2B3]|uniref:hypothetical protein n=1 Tax=Parapedobacter sp. 2B3 TaxID=3342381 RepID=UPI0035B60DD3